MKKEEGEVETVGGVNGTLKKDSELASRAAVSLN